MANLSVLKLFSIPNILYVHSLLSILPCSLLKPPSSWSDTQMTALHSRAPKETALAGMVANSLAWDLGSARAACLPSHRDCSWGSYCSSAAPGFLRPLWRGRKEREEKTELKEYISCCLLRIPARGLPLVEDSLTGGPLLGCGHTPSARHTPLTGPPL